MSAVQAATRSSASDTWAEGSRNADPGYYLVAGGRPAFETAIGFRPPFRSWPGRLNRALGIGGYANAIGAVATVVLALPLIVLASAGLRAC
jgi:cyclic beta-1,2-glucan synthetase